jgi:hypothetical protein
METIQLSVQFFIYSRIWTVALISCLLLIAGSVFSQSNLAYAKISADVVLSDQSSPVFYDCNQPAGSRGGSSLPGLTLNQSANAVLLDNNTNTGIAGQAMFEMIISENGIINKPGIDLVVYETTGPEPFRMSVFDSTSEGYSPLKFIIPKQSEQKNSCGSINTATINLSMFGIADGSVVSRIIIDSLGGPGCCFGSDIVEIAPIEQKADNVSQVINDQGQENKTGIRSSLCLWIYSCT